MQIIIRINDREYTLIAAGGELDQRILENLAYASYREEMLELIRHLSRISYHLIDERL